MFKKTLIACGAVTLIAFTSIIALYLAAAGDYKLPHTVSEDSSLPSVTLEGITFHAEAFGPKDAPVVIVLHGGPGNDYRYLLNLKELSDKYKVVFYDQRGTGLSPRVPEEHLTMENMISDVDLIVRHYGKGKPVKIIGHSWGAMLASAYVGQYPTMASHIVLAEPGMLTTDAARAFMAKFKMNFGWDGIKKLAWLWLQSRHVKDTDDYAKDDYFFTHMMNLDADGSPVADYFCDGRPPKGAMQAWRYNFASNMKIQGEGVSDLDKAPIDLTKGTENYTGKTLFLTGSCNSMIGEVFQRKYHLQYFHDAQLKTIKGSGHTMFGEKPLEALSITRSFFKKS